jgi:hypothetical protein
VLVEVVRRVGIVEADARKVQSPINVDRFGLEPSGPKLILDATKCFPDPSIPITARRRLRAAEAFRLASRMRSTTAVMSVLDCLGIATMSQTDNEMNGSHGAVRDWRAGDDARKQIAHWLSMYEAAVRSSGASRGERQGEIRRNLRASEM